MEEVMTAKRCPAACTSIEWKPKDSRLHARWFSFGSDFSIEYSSGQAIMAAKIFTPQRKRTKKKLKLSSCPWCLCGQARPGARPMPLT
jgi:hypothetical protein